MSREESRKTFLDQLAILYYRKWLFIAPIVIGTLTGLLISYKLPEYYRSTTLILAEEQQVPEEYVTPADRTPFAQRLNVITQQILSRSKLQEIIRDFNLYNTEEKNFLSMLGSAASFRKDDAPVQSGSVDMMRRDILFEVIEDPLTSRTKNGGNAFTITYLGAEPETTMKVTNRLASLFIAENIRARKQYAEDTSEFISAELDKAKKDLEMLEAKIKSFKEQHMGSLPEQLDANLRSLDRLGLELQNVRANIKTNVDRKIYLEEQMKNGTLTAQSVPGNPMAAELDRLRNELAVLRSVYKESYPDVIIMKKRISDLEKTLQGPAEPVNEGDGKAVARIVDPGLKAEITNVKSQIANLRQHETDVQKQIKEYEKRVEDTPGNEQSQGGLLRDYEISRANYQRLLEKQMSARLAENLEERQKGAHFKVIDPANMPVNPDWPDKMMVTLFGFLGGCTVGTGLVFLFEIMNPAFRKPEDFKGVLDHPVLTSIPVFPYVPKKPSKKLTVIKGRE